jgi:hypothetical protein
MHDIKCPHCHKAFKIDETGYADILKQVRDDEFDKQLQERLTFEEKEKENAIALAKSQSELQMDKMANAKDAEIQALKAQISNTDVSKKLAVTEALSDVQKERDALANQIEALKQDKESALALIEAKLTQDIQATAVSKDKEINALQSQISNAELKHEMAVASALKLIEKERDDLKSNLDHAGLQKELSENALKDKYETQIKERDEAIERLRDLKVRLSTKMVGETLEQHCETEFNRIRSTAFPKAYFEKDNDVSGGTKGDYIFRDVDENDTEIVSIMFEMKNEVDTTASKKKNEDFLKQLDKDRIEKGCEYAVLVSLLESDNELYNSGIVDVFHRYPKMYVVRPQFFITIITLLRNAAMKSMEYKRELALVKEQNIDVTSFESDLEAFKSGFARNYDLASRKFSTAIAEIEKSIAHLQKTKDALISTDNNLRLANNKSQDITLKKLTKNNPTMASKFDDLKK